MSHVAYASPLVLEPGRSRYLMVYLVVSHALALVALAVPLNLPLLPRLVLASVVIVSYVWQITRVRPRRLVWQSDGDWSLFDEEENERLAYLSPDSYVSTLLVILRLQLEQGGRCSVVILPDMLDRHSFRRLRVRLHQARLADGAEDTAV